MAGIAWFGAVIYNDFILIPGLMKLPVDQQRAAGEAVGAQATKVIVPAAIAVIVLGIIRGTVFGPIRSVDALFGTAYGLTWLVALAVACLTFSGLLGHRRRDPAVQCARSGSGRDGRRPRDPRYAASSPTSSARA